MDDTDLHNPLVSGSNGLIALRNTLYVPTLLVGLLLVVVRGVTARRTVAVPMCTALVTGVVAILVSALAEGMLESADRQGWLPWLPVAVMLAMLLWTRVAVAWAGRLSRAS